MRIGLTRILDDASLTIEKAHASLTALPICCFAAGVTSLLTVKSSRKVKSSAEP